MTKDEQIDFLVNALKSIQDDYDPWNKDHIVKMMDVAYDALCEWRTRVQELEPDGIPPDSERGVS